jgi:hypothetical protein
MKTVILLGVSRATLSEVMSAYTNHGKIISAKIKMSEIGVHSEGLL